MVVVAEAAQRLRLPLLSNDGDVHEEEIEKWSGLSNSFFDSSTTSFTTNSISSLIGHNNSISSKSSKLRVSPAIIPASSTDVTEAGVGGVPNKFLGITPSFLWQVQKEQKASRWRRRLVTL
ncbi:hypothetical protein ZOSMA_39G00220 [Zostera marina]|uniref:Uncharacterized protein n=1 Tax=Zostera marina TaxID=29655 RepID=A0A0K9P3Y5_ZOSMR|nr:hypothetical protein ZOSMA_39G00220 [Zostera marina]